MKRSVCLEMLYLDAPDFAARIAMAAADGFDAIEFWRWSGKDLDAIKAQADRHGLSITGFLAEPQVALTDPDNHDAFLDGLARSIEVARTLDAPFLYTQAGDPARHLNHAEMTFAVRTALTRAAELLQGTGVTLLLEPLNSVIDHKGCFLDSTARGFDIVHTVDRPEIRLLYDFYHAAAMGEDWRKALPQMHLAPHIHIADLPGRGAPGTGKLPIGAFLQALGVQNYAGSIGFEHR